MDAWRSLLRAGHHVNGDYDASAGRTLLHHVIWQTNARAPLMAHILLSHGADVNARDYHGDSPLAYAIRLSQIGFSTEVIAKVELLLGWGADMRGINASHLPWDHRIRFLLRDYRHRAARCWAAARTIVRMRLPHKDLAPLVARAVLDTRTRAEWGNHYAGLPPAAKKSKRGRLRKRASKEDDDSF
jgi:hypothetical protein